MAAAGYFLLVRVLGNWQEAVARLQEIRFPFLAASFILILVVLLLAALGWSLVLRWLGVSLSLKRSFQIYYLSGLLRYLPGSLWYVAARAYLCQKRGISVTTFSQSLALEVSFIVLSGLAVASPLGFVYMDAPFAAILCGIAWLVIALAVVRPSMVASPLTRFLALFRVKLPTAPASGHQLRKVLAVYLSLWLIYGLAIFGIANVLEPLPLSAFPPIASAYALAWVVGFLVLYVPSGLGVREGALAFLLSPFISPSLAALVALLVRVCEMSGEALCALIANRIAS